MGLKPEDHGKLNSIVSGLVEERRRVFADARTRYKDDGVALQQIDVYDPDSPYRPHILAFRDALETGDKETQEREKAWLREHYPDIR